MIELIVKGQWVAPISKKVLLLDYFDYYQILGVYYDYQN